MADKRIIFFTDNAAVVDIINNQTSKHQGIIVLLRDLVRSCLRHNIIFQARHIPGLTNSSGDYISRSQVTKFWELSPEADQFPTPISDNLLPKSWVLDRSTKFYSHSQLAAAVSACVGRFPPILCSLVRFNQSSFTFTPYLYPSFYFLSVVS